MKCNQKSIHSNTTVYCQETERYNYALIIYLESHASVDAGYMYGQSLNYF